MRETGSTSGLVLALRRRSTGLRLAAGCVCSLLFFGVSPRPLWAASQLEVQIDGTVIPFSIGDLAKWARSDGRHRSELSTWFSLLAPESRAGVLELLQAPVILDRSMVRQLLNNMWFYFPKPALQKTRARLSKNNSNQHVRFVFDQTPRGKKPVASIGQPGRMLYMLNIRLGKLADSGMRTFDKTGCLGHTGPNNRPGK